MSISSGCVYNSSQPMGFEYASAFQNYGICAGAAVSVITTPVLRVMNAVVSVIDFTVLHTGNRHQVPKMTVGYYLAPPIIGLVAGRVFGTIVDYAIFKAERLVCTDINKN